MDQQGMNQAFAVLRERFGERLAGDRIKGEVLMRQALMERMQVDESAADKIVKQLAQTGWLRFVSAAAMATDASAGAEGVAGVAAPGESPFYPAGRAPGGEAHQPDAWNQTQLTESGPAADMGVPVEPPVRVQKPRAGCSEKKDPG